MAVVAPQGVQGATSTNLDQVIGADTGGPPSKGLLKAAAMAAVPPAAPTVPSSPPSAVVPKVATVTVVPPPAPTVQAPSLPGAPKTAASAGMPPPPQSCRQRRVQEQLQLRWQCRRQRWQGRWVRRPLRAQGLCKVRQREPPLWQESNKQGRRFLQRPRGNRGLEKRTWRCVCRAPVCFQSTAQAWPKTIL